jgi:hypothetical protein
VTRRDAVVPGPAEERRHEPGAAPEWCEWWYVDFARADGCGGFVRLALYPNRDVAWYWAYVMTPGAPGPVVVRDHEVPMPRQAALEVRADGLWAECTCEVPFEHWTYGLEAFGVRLDDPADAFRGEIGERLPVGADLEWEVESPGLAFTDRYEQAGRVHGDVLVGRERIDFDGVGMRGHGWGEQALWARGRAWVGLHAPGFALAGSGDEACVWRGGDEVAVTDVAIEVSAGEDGLPTGARCAAGAAPTFDLDVLATAVVPLEGESGNVTALARSLCRATSPGGDPDPLGWLECPLA